jgi:hypothetical protein
MVTCPLCAYEFDPQDLNCTGHCPLAAVQGCSLICCPNCGYEMVDVEKSRLVYWLRRAGLALHRAAKPATERGQE